MRRFIAIGVALLAGFPSIGFTASADFMVTYGADDAYTDLAGGVHTNTTEILHGGATDWNAPGSPPISRYHAGFRFNTTGVYRGQVIQSAALKFYIGNHYVWGSGTDYYIFGDKTPQSPDFSVPNSGPKERADTSGTLASASWYKWEHTPGYYHSSPDIAAVIQEVVDAPTWASGDPMTLLMTVPSYSATVIGSPSYEGNPLQTARLEIEYASDQFIIAAGATGEFVLGQTGLRLNVTSPPADPVTLTASRTDVNPVGTFSGSGATGPDSSVIVPNIHSDGTYWTVTADGPLVGLSYEISIDTAGLPGISNPDKLLILKRSNSTAPWEALNTSRSGATLTAGAQTTFSEFTVGSHSSFNTLPAALSAFTLE